MCREKTGYLAANLPRQRLSCLSIGGEVVAFTCLRSVPHLRASSREMLRIRYGRPPHCGVAVNTGLPDLHGAEVGMAR